MEYRIEHDTMGEVRVPADHFWGAQTQRSLENFAIGTETIPAEVIRAFAVLKSACAASNMELGRLDRETGQAITEACAGILEGRYPHEFPLKVWQTGSGTQSNMNVNEVIAHIAAQDHPGLKIHPNDHVNLGQSTNDVIPTAGKMTTIRLLMKLRLQLQCLQLALSNKAEEFDHVIKMGRTQMQDAVPIRLGQEFRAYADAVTRNIGRIEKAADEMRYLNMGGTAIGTGVNADTVYLQRIVPVLNEVSGMEFVQAADLIDSTQNLDPFVAVSGAVKTCAVTLSKIANDLRLMSSGPRAGFGEINLPAMQNGSSIMPGKVNPVIPEVVNQVSFNVIGNDVTITMAAEAGQLELNAFEPIIFYNLFQSIDTMGFATETFVDNCITGITANEERCRELVEKSVGIVTTLAPVIGYQRAADIAKKALKQNRPVREIILEEKIMEPEELSRILDPVSMTEPGIRH